MPLNASPVTISSAALETKRKAAKHKLHVNLGFYGGVVPGSEADLEELIKDGVLGIKAFLTHSGIDEFPNITEKELNAVMPILAEYDLPLLVHCELTDEEHLEKHTKDPASYQNYLQGRPKEWEDKAIEQVIRLCRRHACRVHIVHVSSASALDMIRKAKEAGLPLTAETCPHYIFFEAESIPDGNTLFKCAPPIREKANNEKLKQALAEGVLDFISSDHSPAPANIKELSSGNLLKAWGGIAGLQFLLTAGWTALKNNMSIGKFIPLVNEAPARFLGLDQKKGRIAKGYDADLVAWLPETDFEVKEEAIFHKHKISPYVSRRLFGKVSHTIVNGSLVFENSEFVNHKNGRVIEHIL
jgi:allantoinase